MPITQEQALELADKYLLYTERIALRDNISVSRSAKEWRIVAKTTPIILGMETEITTFPIDMETGEVGVSITTKTVSITNVLREIDEKKDLDEPKKEQLKAKVEEFEKDSTKKPVDKKKMDSLRKYFEDYAQIFSFAKSIIDFITTVLSKLP
jgi:hypothetical protein